MLTEHIALVSRTNKISAKDMALTAAALQKQAMHDLGPAWGIKATVEAFPDLKSVPLGYWFIVIDDELSDKSVEGYHQTRHKQPYSLVGYDESWQYTCSHEMCEMLVDPWGNRLHVGNSITNQDERVLYLVEVCDPCSSFGYRINGIYLSDFYTPDFFDPVKSPGKKYSFTGALTKPGEVRKGGYITWYDPAKGSWHQADYFGEKLRSRKLGLEEITGSSIRSHVDRATTNPNKMKAYKTQAAKTNTASIVKSRNVSVKVGDMMAGEIEWLTKKAK